MSTLGWLARRLVMAASVAMLLAVLAAAALWWWAGTPASLAWALERFGAPQGLAWTDATGSLRQGLRAATLRWQQPQGLQVEATGVDLAWEPRALLRRELHVLHLRAQAVRIRSSAPPDPTPPQPPASVALPVAVAVDELRIGRLDAAEGAPLVEEIAARYAYRDATHRLGLDGLRAVGTSVQGTATLGAQDTLPLQAALQGRAAPVLPGGSQTFAVRWEAQAQGPLRGFALDARVVGDQAPADTAPQATLSAQVTPWDVFPVPRAQAELRRLDAAALWAQAPRTLLDGRLAVVPAGTASWQIEATLANAAPGPWDARQLPVQALQARALWADGGAQVPELAARVGGGQVQGGGSWHPRRGWQAQARLDGVQPGALHTALAGPVLDGRLSGQGDGEGAGIGFSADLRARGGAVPRVRSELAADIAALDLRSLRAEGRWAGGVLTLPTLQVRTADATLDGERLRVQPALPAGEGRLRLAAPGVTAQAEGSLAPDRGNGSASVEGSELAQALAWLRRLPGVPDALDAVTVQGRASASARWQGGWRDPALQARVLAPALQVATGAQATPTYALRDLQASVEGRLSDAALELRGQLLQGQRRAALALAGRAGRTGPADAAVLQAEVRTLTLAASDPGLTAGEWTLRSQAPFTARWLTATRQLEATGGEAVLRAPVRSGPAEALLRWEPVRWGQGELQTAGRLSGLPLAWADLLGVSTDSLVSGDLRFDARWDARLGSTVQLRAEVARTQGDLTVLAENAEGVPTRVGAGVREARLLLESAGEALTLSLRWDSERAGTAEGRVRTRLAPGGDAGWQWLPQAPLEGFVRARLPRIGVWSVLAPPGWRLRGSLAADLQVAGTRADPQLAGTLAADDLGLRSVVDGVALQDGRLRARLAGQRVVIEEFVLRGARQDGGLLRATGSAQRAGGSWQLEATATLERLRASVRSDRQLTVSGQLQARVDGAAAQIGGRLVVDQARIVLPEETAPKLGDDVLVRNLPGGVQLGMRPPSTASAGAAARAVQLQVAIDLGNDFRVQGRGIDTRLRGELALSGESLAEPRLVGTIRTVGGEYQAYGQRLDIERGVLRFTGPLDNPALDILAVRPRLVQRAGVQVTGTAQAPFVRLYSEPQLSEAETLSWLVLGRASATGGAEAALLQQAAVALLASRGRSGASGGGIAGRFGLDELSVRRDGSEGAAITLGKRFARNFYASYERSLSGALGTLFIFYDVSRRLTVRAQAGERSAVDLIYTLTYD